MLLLKKGISVLICTFNGSDTILETISHLKSQTFNEEIPWEIIVVDNASTDDTSFKVECMRFALEETVPIRLFFESRKGKENAIDKGLMVSKYKYVIICDDDNWLQKNYLQTAFDIMEANPTIGILGGKGVIATNGSIPQWFNAYKTYFAIGEQHYLNGEIKHFWPKYKFIWGAGSVINKSSYDILLNSGFKRILKHKEVGAVSRSEDLELCFAIWLTGYKLWFDDRLVYRHFISSDRLTINYLIKIIKVSTSAIQYLKPYNIIKFTGVSFCPKKTFWLLNIKSLSSTLINKSTLIEDIIMLTKILRQKDNMNPLYIQKLICLRQFLASIKLGYRYTINFKKVLRLQMNIDSYISNRRT